MRNKNQPIEKFFYDQDRNAEKVTQFAKLPERKFN